MKKNSIKKIILYFACFIASSIGIAITLLSIFLIRIHYAPLDIHSFSQPVARVIQVILPYYKISFDTIRITWQGVGEPIILYTRNLNIEEKKNGFTKFSFPELNLSIRASELLQARLSLRTLKLSNPSFTLRLNNIPSSSRSFSQSQAFALSSTLNSYLIKQHALSKLKTANIANAEIRINGSSGSQIIHISGLNLTLDRKNKKQEFHCSTSQGGVRLTAQGFIDMPSKEINAKIQVNTLFQKPLFENLKDNTFLNLMKNTLLVKKITCPFTLDASIQYSAIIGLKEASINFDIREGIMELPAYLAAPLEIKEGLFKASYNDQVFTIKKLRLKTIDTQIEGLAQGQWNPQQSIFTITGKAEAYKVAFNSLHKYWPAYLAPTPREWVIANLKNGNVPKATFEIESKISLKHDKIETVLNTIKGNIQIQDATVSYFQDMPKIEHVHGEASYSNKDFLIKITSGSTHQLKIKEGQIRILDLNKSEQKIDIRLNVKGALQHHLSFIDHKPLEYVKKLNLNTSRISGEANTDVHLFFPLVTSLTLNDIRFNVLSTLEKVRLDNLLNTDFLYLSQGTFDFNVNNQAMKLEGNGSIKGIISKIKWQRNFNINAPFVTSLTMNGTINQQTFKEWPINFIQNFKGQAPIEIHYICQQEPFGILNATVDLTHAQGDILGWKKQKSKKCILQSHVEMNNFKPEKLTYFKVNAVDEVKIEGKGLFDTVGLKELSFSPFKLGLTDIELKIVREKDKNYFITLWGHSLNLTPVWKDIIESHEKESRSTIDLKAKLNLIKLGEDKYIYNNDLHLLYDNTYLEFLNFRAQLSRKTPASIFQLELTKPDDQTRKLKLKTLYGGKFLKAFNIYDNIYGGVLKIIAIQSNRNREEPWMGKLVLANFSLKKAPIMGKLLSLAFPTGVVDLFSEKGLPFNIFRCKFNVLNNKVILSKGRANSLSIGLTVAGAIDLRRKNMQLYGSVIPAYFLNTILSKIPIIGELASGGKHEGIFSVSYTISGSQDNPLIQVNPATLFAPGFIRKIFESDNGEDFEVDEDDEEFEEFKNAE